MTASVPRNADSWTLDDLENLPEDGNRYELIEGRLLVSPAPATPHLRATTLLHRLLLRAAPDHLVVGQNGGIVAGPGKQTYFIPDVIVIPVTALDGDRPALVPADTLLAVEILSPGSSTTDDVTKRYYYARMGIPRYWIVDPKRQTLTAMLLDPSSRTFHDEAVVHAGESWHTDEPFPVKLDPAEFC